MILTMKDKIIEELRLVFDPEIPVNIYDLGMIYEIEIKDSMEVKIVMTLTSPNCPEVESLPGEVRDRILKMDGVKDVEIELTFDPPWDQSMLSEEAKLELGFL